MENYYRILGVSKNASDDEIKSSYRKLARQLHPDVNPGSPEAEERFKKVNEAYQVLGDKTRRKNYDEFGSNWEHADEIRQGRSGRHGFSYRGGERFDLNDILNKFGGSFGKRFDTGNTGHTPAQVNADAQVTLEEAFKGTVRRLSIMSQGGESAIEVKIPPGVRDGDKISLHHKGVKINLRVSVLPHERFTRTGDDLHTEIATPLAVALLGGEVKVETIDGAVALSIPPNTQNGKSFRLRGKGMLRRKNERGDLLVVVRVVLPVPLTEKQRRDFGELLSNIGMKDQ